MGGERVEGEGVVGDQGGIRSPHEGPIYGRKEGEVSTSLLGF